MSAAELPICWTAEEVAKRLSKSPSWVKKMAAANKLPHRYVGRDLRFVPKQIADWLEEQTEPDGLPPSTSPKKTRR